MHRTCLGPKLGERKVAGKAAGEDAVEAFFGKLPEDRRAALKAVRETIRANLPEGYEEQVGGMISYVVPLSRFPKTYNKQPLMLAAIAAPKTAMALHLVAAYLDPAMQSWFETAYRATGKRFDMGAGCVRFRKLDDLPLDLVGQAIARVPMERYVAMHEAAAAARKKK